MALLPCPSAVAWLAAVVATTSPDTGFAQQKAGPSRLVAIGDLHGDLDATKAALRLAGAIDERERWIGGNLVIVQTGDLLDKGDDDVAMLYFLVEIRTMAERAGGRLVLLNGNHELMNAHGDYRYVTFGGFTACRDLFGPKNPRLRFRDDDVRDACFAPGAPLARLLAQHDTIAIIGDTVFVHGGILPKYVQYGIDQINQDVSRWLMGDGGPPPWFSSRDSPVWYRGYSQPSPGTGACATLQRALAALGVVRMVVGHTIQDQINSACEGRIWRIDVGMADSYGGPVEVLEIGGDRVKRLTASPSP